jgi:biotin carboxyl carrier protein
MKKTLRITVNGKVYDVVAEILGEEAAAPRVAEAAAGLSAAGSAATAAVEPSPRRPAATPPAGGTGAIVSPLAGKVVSIHAAVGNVVAAGQTVFTLEAMKMNTIVSAASGGTVATIHVSTGDAVEEGQLLMTLR